MSTQETRDHLFANRNNTRVSRLDARCDVLEEKIISRFKGLEEKMDQIIKLLEASINDLYPQVLGLLSLFDLSFRDRSTV